jgi:hypothetical protein
MNEVCNGTIMLLTLVKQSLQLTPTYKRNLTKRYLSQVKCA